MSASPGILTTKIGSCVEESTGHSSAKVVRIWSKWQCTEFGLCNRYHSHCSQIHPG